MKKYLFYTLALVGCWFLTIEVHTLVSVFYEKNFTYTIIHGVSWGLSIYFLFYYYNAVGLLLSFLLFNGKEDYFLYLMDYFP